MVTSFRKMLTRIFPDEIRPAEKDMERKKFSKELEEIQQCR